MSSLSDDKPFSTYKLTGEDSIKPAFTFALLSEPEYDVILQKDQKAKMRDGVTLYADIYLPAKDGVAVEGRYPTILVRTSYNKEAAESNLDPAYFAKRGYAVMLQDVRGRYRSEGAHYHGVNEANDGYDTIEWIAKQPWSDGKTGMTGVSYLAAVQTAAALSGTPHLTSLFHVKAPPDYYHLNIHPGGAFRMYVIPVEFLFAATSPEGFADPVLVKAFEEEFIRGDEWLSRFPLKEGLTPLSRAPSLERNTLDWIHHTDYDEFWKNVRLWQAVEHWDEHSDVAGYYFSGWYDMYSEERFYAPLKKQQKQPLKLQMGPWTHTDRNRTSGDVDFGPDAEMSYEEYNELQLRWFDQTMKGIDTGIVGEPPVKIFVMGGGNGRKTPEGKMYHGGRWRDENEWPLARTRYTPYHLHGDGTLSAEKSAETKSLTTYTYDPKDPVPTIGGTSYFLQLVRGLTPLTAKEGVPRNRMKLFVPYGPYDQRERLDAHGCKTTLPLSSRHDVIVFQTPPLTREVEVTGPISAKIWASSSAASTDFVARLIDVYPANEDYPDGYAMNLSDGIIRGHYRNGTEKKVMMKPGEVYEFNIDMAAVSNFFAEGHRIRVDISSSNYPQYDRNPNTGDPYIKGGKTLVADNTLYHDSGHPSHIVLPIIPPGK